jgi:hypothetical protein
MLKYLGELWQLFRSKKSAEGLLGKNWFWSKTLWVNFLAFVVMILGDKVGIHITGEETTSFLVLVNMVLRFISNTPIGWKDV